MLVLTRRPGEQIIIDGGVTITVVQTRSGAVQLGIDAPRDKRVMRAELVKPLESKPSE